MKMDDEKVIPYLMDIEEKNYLLQKKAFEFIKLSAEITALLEQISNNIYYEE